MLVRENTRRKCGEIVVVESEYERCEEREDDNGMEREWREVKEERPVKMEEEREERLLELSQEPERKRGMKEREIEERK